MPIDPKRAGDIKVLIGASIAVLLLGFFIAGAALVTTRGSDGIECGQLRVGLASDIRSTLENGPYASTGGGSCTFWLALENDNIVAYKAIQPSGCTAKLKLDRWECGARDVPAEDLAQYPVSIRTVKGVDVVVVNLGTAEPSTTT